ncbi:hypothetical protein [Piscinibacter koreensis]|uniref:Nucleotidyltransferase n=1 Tax=Piscinibacter koreensis TaxID=2742824 RepID=A0A7Y6NMB3_9BURK|nr:hypothetical protein [Schlegelella koreensis]NUZ05707.1 hypothetical protein [Schlegelella koreensis]
MPSRLTEEIAASAARLVVEEGLDYGAAKRRAARDLGANPRSSELPGNDAVEDDVREYIALFCADTQPAELAELRRIAIRWMERLERFRPHLTGAVWRGTATRRNDIHIDLFCDDSKAAELALLDLDVDYEVGSTTGPNGRTLDVLSVATTSRELGMRVVVLFTILDYDDLRGALKLDAGGRSLRGDLAGARALAADDA